MMMMMMMMMMMESRYQKGKKSSSSWVGASYSIAVLPCHLVSSPPGSQDRSSRPRARSGPTLGLDEEDIDGRRRRSQISRTQLRALHLFMRKKYDTIMDRRLEMNTYTCSVDGNLVISSSLEIIYCIMKQATRVSPLKVPAVWGLVVWSYEYHHLMFDSRLLIIACIH